MSLQYVIEISGNAMAATLRLGGLLVDRSEMNARLATDMLRYVQDFGSRTVPEKHQTANTLGATPTGHLEQAYQAVQQVSGDSSASLIFPRASRLRAAFGPYAIVPTNGKTYLTIPAAAEAYGKRAGEFSDLFFLRVGPNQTPILARATGRGQIQTMYVLVKQANIPEASDLLPWAELPSEAGRSIENWIDEQVKDAIK